MDHLCEITGVMRSELSPVGKSFLDACGDTKVSVSQAEVLYHRASLSGKELIGPRLSDTRHFFADGIAKSVSGFESKTEPARLKNLMDALIFARWDAQNFETMFSKEIPDSALKYPASRRGLKTYEQALAYMTHSVEPVIVARLCEGFGIDKPALDSVLEQREFELLDSELKGLEVLRPLPSDWSAPAMRI